MEMRASFTSIGLRDLGGPAVALVRIWRTDVTTMGLDPSLVLAIIASKCHSYSPSAGWTLIYAFLRGFCLTIFFGNYTTWQHGEETSCPRSPVLNG